MSFLRTAGREVSGAVRSFSYDLRTSTRFRSLVGLTVGVAAIIMVAGVLLARGVGEFTANDDNSRENAAIANQWGQGDSQITDQEDNGRPPPSEADPTTSDEAEPAPPPAPDSSSTSDSSEPPPEEEEEIERPPESGSPTTPDELSPVPTDGTPTFSPPPDDEDEDEDDDEDDDKDDDDNGGGKD